MKYGVEVDRVELNKDCYAEHFAEPGDLKYNYQVFIDGDCIDEDSDKIAMAKRLRKLADRLVKIANFLDRKRTKGTPAQETRDGE